MTNIFTPLYQNNRQAKTNKEQYWDKAEKIIALLHTCKHQITKEGNLYSITLLHNQDTIRCHLPINRYFSIINTFL